MWARAAATTGAVPDRTTRELPYPLAPREVLEADRALVPVSLLRAGVVRVLLQSAESTIPGGSRSCCGSPRGRRHLRRGRGPFPPDLEPGRLWPRGHSLSGHRGQAYYSVCQPSPLFLSGVPSVLPPQPEPKPRDSQEFCREKRDEQHDERREDVKSVLNVEQRFAHLVAKLQTLVLSRDVSVGQFGRRPIRPRLAAWRHDVPFVPQPSRSSTSSASPLSTRARSLRRFVRI